MTRRDRDITPDTRLADYALGTLEPTETAETEELLARSAEARAELRSLRASLVRLTEALPPVEPPAHVWTGLEGRLEAAPDVPEPLPEAEAPPSSRAPRNTYLAWALSACLALVAVGELVWIGALQTVSRQAEREVARVADFLSVPETQKISLYGRQREALGSVLARPDGQALFVLEQAPPEGQSYQAWGHTNDDWEPGSSAQLTSLKVSDKSVLEVETQNFAALYLSLEPPGGSPQPTYPISRVSLGEPVATAPLRVTSPLDGAELGRDVIVTGVVAPDITELRYSLNGKVQRTTTAGSRFSFTVSLRPGVNELVVEAAGPQGVAAETLTLTRAMVR